MNKKKIAIIMVAIIAVWAMFNFNHLITLENAKAQQAELNLYISDNWLAASAIYFILYILTTALSVPGAAIISLLGAALFGFWWGLVLVSFASSIGATLAFLFSRYLLRDWVQKKFGNKLSAINSGIERDGNLYLLTLRLIPVFPFFLINLLMGLSKMSVSKFYLYSQLGMLPGTMVYLNAGTQLADIETLSGLLSPAVLTSLAILGLFPLVAKFVIGKINNKKILSK
jgi:uncharacterized membrane protein YdjX (TVP38/TMEM64 family)